MSALAVAAAALAALLLVRPPPRLAPRWSTDALGGGRLALVALGLAVAVVAPSVGGLAVVVAGAGAGGLGLWRRRRRRRAAEQVAAQVLETCELLAGELAAGRPPGEALQRAAAAWAPLAQVAEAFRVGADVPGSLRELAGGLEGAGDLRVVAAAWQVAHRTGQGLASALDRVVGSLRAAASTRRVVSGELGSARATARLVAGLPVLALAMGSGAGGDPWGFLVGEPAGLACLSAGLACGFAGLWWIEAIAASAEDAR